MKNIKRVTIAAVMAISVLCVADAASAASPSAQNVCVSKATGVTRYLRKIGKQTCAKSEVKLIWNPTDVAGATGGVVITQQSVCDGPDGDITADELCKIGMTGPGA